MIRPRLGLLLALGACASTSPPKPEAKKVDLDPVLGEKNPRAPEAGVLPAGPGQERAVAIVDATLLLGTGKRIERGTVLLRGGKIEALGADLAVPEGARVIDGRGKFVTPGLIDTHSHLGVYAAPFLAATADGNEMTDPATPYVYSEHAFWPGDPQLRRVLAGGVTTMLILPGSGNVIGGRAVTVRTAPSREARAMRFAGAPNGLKMACGENPKRVYGEKGRAPMSRMGNIARLRQEFIKAQAYLHGQRTHLAERAKWQTKYDKAKEKPEGAEDPGKEPTGSERDLGKETLADVLEKKIKVHIHCYRADEMLQMIALAKELGFEISSFHHATEAYKIADVLAKEGIGASMWADWWGFKLEAYDAVEENVAMVAAAGGRAIVHSDSGVLAQRLNQEAAKALHSGKRLGIAVDEDMAIAWITANPAWALGILDKTGTLEAGKLGDVVLWNKHPLSMYASAERVFIEGVEVFDRAAPAASSDFEVGTDVEGVIP